MAQLKWHVWADRGGTFTDVIARAPDGAVHTLKLLSENPGQYDDAIVAAMRRITGVHEGDLPSAELRVGTTLATNALLERKGEPVCLAITSGFADALLIGYQERPELFVRQIIRPDPIYARVVEIGERVTAAGEVLVPLDAAAARTELQAAFDAGLRALAIVLMHGYRYPAHEAALAEIAAEIGFTQVSVSHLVAPLIKLIGRGDTTVVDAYLSPVLRRYVGQLAAGTGPEVEPLFMQSNGGLVDGAHYSGRNAILSGPAGGIVGMARTASEAGIDAVIGFDMGGTSTDVSWFAGHYERDNETRVAGARIRAPMLRIHTVAAGGGSICRFDGSRLLVGPQSAGAVPGPACYRRGGPLTITDCNVLLGRILPAHFPQVFGPEADQPIDAAIVREKFEALCPLTGMTPEQTAEGFLAVAVANMANAIKTVTVQRGHDATRATLVCFGGAGGQHACAVADALAIDRIMVHAMSGVLSAYGIGLADRQAMREKTLGLFVAEGTQNEIDRAIAELAAAAEGELREQGVDGAIEHMATIHLRQDGADGTIEVSNGSITAMRADFEARHVARFGFASEGALVVETASVEAISRTGTVPLGITLPVASEPPLETVLCYLGGAYRETPVYRRSGLAAGFRAIGPTIVLDPVATIVVEQGWQAEIDRLGNLILTRHGLRAAPSGGGTSADPVRLEVFNGLFMAIAEDMGAALQHSASSVNIRERLDFSCAIFDAEGSLVANAPHMPVHLGSMGESVRAILKHRAGAKDGRGILPGDAYALNAPYEGGTHLPDITVIMPVFVDADTPAFYVAARGHHADVGGITPGSMPPGSTSVEEEGVLLDNVLLVSDGRFLESEIAAILGSGRWPSRNVAQNIADLKAQAAACAKGAAELVRISRDYGQDVVCAFMGHVQANAEAAVRRLISRLSDGHFRYAMDNGSVIEVRVAVDQTARSATVDFSGTSAQLASNFNAPLPVVRAAVMYVMRTLIDEPIPLNEGCLKPITIIAPQGCMLNPRFPAAVVAGNVETSQAITDAIFGALGAMAAAQGTMNNFTFGNAQHQYYETIAGGSGAGPGFDGTDVVQTHMTNSRLTDPEILESRFPVLLEAFSIRRGSGGIGAHRGGDGAVRRIRFLEAMEAGILSNRREVAPFGLAGGAPGAAGMNRVERADGRIEQLGATASVAMEPGDVFVIATPGGGGYGAADR